MNTTGQIIAAIRANRDAVFNEWIGISRARGDRAPKRTMAKLEARLDDYNTLLRRMGVEV